MLTAVLVADDPRLRDALLRLDEMCEQAAPLGREHPLGEGPQVAIRLLGRAAFHALGWQEPTSWRFVPGQVRYRHATHIPPGPGRAVAVGLALVPASATTLLRLMYEGCRDASGATCASTALATEGAVDLRLAATLLSAVVAVVEAPRTEAVTTTIAALKATYALSSACPARDAAARELVDALSAGATREAPEPDRADAEPAHVRRVRTHVDAAVDAVREAAAQALAASQAPAGGLSIAVADGVELIAKTAEAAAVRGLGSPEWLAWCRLVCEGVVRAELAVGQTTCALSWVGDALVARHRPPRACAAGSRTR